jgi:hypothetical protein
MLSLNWQAEASFRASRPKPILITLVASNMFHAKPATLSVKLTIQVVFVAEPSFETGIGPA